MTALLLSYHLLYISCTCFLYLHNVLKNNFKINSQKIFFCTLTWFYIYLFWVVSIFLNCSGDIRKKPGPKAKLCQGFSICYSNLNIIFAHNFSKMSLLQAYNAVLKYDIICLSETYLNSSIRYDDGNLDITWYVLIFHVKIKGEVFVFTTKNELPLNLLDIHILK